MEHTGETFTTPVFNGSASLRDAAGSLIESAAKAARRKKTVDDKFFEELFSDTVSLYRLDQLDSNTASNEKADLGPLPKSSVILLSSLVVIWIILGTLFLLEKIRNKK